MLAPSTALRLTGRDVLPLLHRTTSNALDDLPLLGARATLFCDFRGRLQHRAVVAMASDGAVWLLRLGESCWTWHQRGLECLWISSPSARV